MGLSQEELPHRAGVHRTYISFLELGERNPSVDSLLKIGRALGVPASRLVAESEDAMEELADMAPQALYDELRQVAGRRGLTSYWDLAPCAGIDRGNPYFAVHLGRLLDEVNRSEHAAGRPLLSAVVVGTARNAPGSGFFTLARELELHSGSDDDGFWLAELNRVYDYWSRQQGGLSRRRRGRDVRPPTG